MGGIRSIIAAAAAGLLLAGCAPQYGNGYGSYGNGGYGRSPAQGPVFGAGQGYGIEDLIFGSGSYGRRDRDRGEVAQRARAACIRRAGREDFEVRDVLGQGAVRGGYQVDLRLRRGDAIYDGACLYDSSDERAVLADVDLVRRADRPRSPEPRISAREVRRACRDRAKAAGFAVARVGDVRRAGGDDVSTRLRVRRGDDRVVLTCRVDTSSGSIDLS
jgi:hypothetical protein